MALEKYDLEKIDRYIRGEANDIEKKYVESLFLNGENNQYLRHSLEKDWNSILRGDTTSETNISHLLDRIHHTIRREESLKMQKPLHRLITIYSKIAAIFLIPLILTGIVYYMNSYSGSDVSSEIFAPPGSRVAFTLPDGTNGVLNGGSKLNYNMPFERQREISLEGEAWLEVKHDTKHPFMVSTGNSTVQVVGTSFNISSYQDENFIEVVLKEGKVKFTGHTGDKEVAMVPSERLVYQNGRIYKSVVDPYKYNAWIDGKLVFRSDSMTEVARRIERWYNVKVNIADDELKKYIFRATFEDDKLEDILKFLAMTSPIMYKIIPRKLLPDGTYQKEEIIIYKR